MRTLANQLSQKIGQEVTVSGFAHEFRKLSKMSFLILRERTGYIQVFIPKAVFHENIHSESVVQITGIVKEEAQCRYGYEVSASEVKIISAAEVLPFPLNAPEEVPFHTLNNFRPLTLRGKKERCIFKIQAEIIHAYREYMRSEGFTEIQSTKLSAAGLEGGSDVFEVNYFGEKIYLTQSPQFYKQMMVGVYERVFEIGKVYRAEGSNTNRHLSEFIGFEFEVGFIESFREIMQYEQGALNYIFKHLEVACRNELEYFGITLELPGEIPSITYNEVLELFGVNEITSEVERNLGKYAIENLKSEFIFITNYPKSERPFYSMPNGELTETFDLLYKGVEITSGGQRIHNYTQLIQSIKEKGLNPELFNSYLMPFKYGMPPHGGMGIGLERIIKQMLNLNVVEEASLIPRTKDRFIH